MNLYTGGEFAASDWLHQKLRERGIPLSLFVRDDGEMRVRDARYLPDIPVSNYVGVYAPAGFSVAAARADLAAIREEYWRSRRDGVGMIRPRKPKARPKPVSS